MVAVDRLRLRGRYVAGAAPGRFVQLVDLRSGYNRTDITTGGLTALEGYDGSP